MANGVKVAVVGAGQMGTGIAHAFAAAGYQAWLVDLRSDILERASAAVAQIFNDGVARGKLAPEAAQAGTTRLHTSTNLAEAASDAGLLVETASEDIALKLKLITDAEPLLAPGAMIATNTSALSVTEIAAATADPSRVLGMHFFNPVQKMRLLELVAGIDTSRETIERARAIGESLGKEVIVVNDSPGLTTSRMSALMGNEAMYMLEAGVASAEDIDTALRLGFNHPMGPLELGDLTGWDTRLRVLQYLYSTLGERYRPCPLIIKMVKSGRVGRKAGAGVYKYEDSRKVPGSGLTRGLL